MKLKYHDIEQLLYAPGDIFWLRANDKKSLINKKGDPVNYDLIKKLDDADHQLYVDESDFKFYKMFDALFDRYNQSLLMKEKLYVRDEIIALFREEFIEDRRTQFDLDLLCWSLFSNLTADQGWNLEFKDSILFKRHLRVASAYALCAFFIGYYDMKFLKELFTSTLQNLMTLGEGVQYLSLKEKLEYVRIQGTFTDEVKDVIGQFAESDANTATMFLERYDGSGQKRMNYREMSDLQIILVALNQGYGFKADEMYTNLLRDIELGDLKCEPKVLKMLQRSIYKKSKNILAGQITG